MNPSKKQTWVSVLAHACPPLGKDNMTNTDHEHGYQEPWSWPTYRHIILEQ